MVLDHEAIQLVICAQCRQKRPKLTEGHAYLIATAIWCLRQLPTLLMSVLETVMQLCKRKKNRWIYLAKLFYQTYICQDHMTARWKILFGMPSVILSHMLIFLEFISTQMN